MTESFLRLSSVNWHDQVWIDSARCGQLDQAELFFSPDSGRTESQKDKDVREKMAKLICSQCTVREDCLKFALVYKEEYGIWGGMTEDERKAFLKQRRRRAGVIG